MNLFKNKMLNKQQKNKEQELVLKIFDNLIFNIILSQNTDKQFNLVDYLENFRNKIKTNFKEIQDIKQQIINFKVKNKHRCPNCNTKLTEFYCPSCDK